MKKWQKKAIKEIMEEFDFDTVHKVMTHLNWEWHYAGIPTINELKENALNKLIKVCDEGKGEEYYFIDSGGFVAEYNGNNKSLTLSFVITDYTVEKPLKNDIK